MHCSTVYKYLGNLVVSYLQAAKNNNFSQNCMKVSKLREVGGVNKQLGRAVGSKYRKGGRGQSPNIGKESRSKYQDWEGGGVKVPKLGRGEESKYQKLARSKYHNWKGGGVKSTKIGKGGWSQSTKIGGRGQNTKLGRGGVKIPKLESGAGSKYKNWKGAVQSTKLGCGAWSKYKNWGRWWGSKYWKWRWVRIPRNWGGGRYQNWERGAG